MTPEWVIPHKQLSCPSPRSCWWSRGSLTSLQGFSCPVPLKLPRTCSSSSWWQELQLGMKIWVHLDYVCWLCVPLSSKTEDAGGTPGSSLYCIVVWVCSPPLLSKCAHMARSGGEWQKSWGENGTLPSLYLQLRSSGFSSVSFSLGVASSHLPSLPLTFPYVERYREGGLLLTEVWALHPVLPINSATLQRQKWQAVTCW